MTIRYVSHSGTNQSPYTSPATAASTIQAAISACSSGDTIWVKADQPYVLSTFVGVGAITLTIKGYLNNIGDMDYGGIYYKNRLLGYTIINSNNLADHNFQTSSYDYTATFENFKFINNNINYSSIYSLSRLQVFNCWFNGGGVGVYADGTHEADLIYDNLFDGTWGGADKTPVIIGNSVSVFTEVRKNIFNLTGCRFGVEMPCEDAMLFITDNIFYCTGEITEAIISYDYEYGDDQNISIGSIICRNNTIYGTPGSIICPAIHVEGIPQGTIEKNIIIGTEGDSIDYTPTFTSLLGYNCFYNNSTDPFVRIGDILEDPMLVDPENGDFRPMNSHCIGSFGYMGAVPPITIQSSLKNNVIL